MERIELSPLNGACVFLVVPSCTNVTKCELQSTIDGKLLPAVHSLTVWRDKKILMINLPDKEKVSKFKRVRLDHEGSQINLSIPEDNFIDSQWIYLLDIKSENEREFKIEDKNSICRSFLQIWLESSRSNIQSGSLLALLRTARSVKADLGSIFARCSKSLTEIMETHPTVSNVFSLIFSIELQNLQLQEAHALNLLPGLLDNSPMLENDLPLQWLILDNLPYHTMNYQQRLNLFCFLCGNTKIQNSAHAAVDKLLSRLLPSILSNIGIALNEMLKLSTMGDWLAKEVINKSMNALLDVVDPDAMFVSLSAFLEFAYRRRVDVNRSKITAIVKQFVHRHNCNAEVIHFLNSVPAEFARFEPCCLVLSELAAVLLKDTTICLDLSGHELCKMVERLHSEYTVSSEALRQLVERLQSLSNGGLSSLLLLLAQSNFADETTAVCFTAATQHLEKDLKLLLELSVVAKYKSNAAIVLDGCFASFPMTMLFELAADSNELEALSHSSFLSLLQKMHQTLLNELKHFGNGVVEDKVDEVNTKIQTYLSLKPGRSLQTKLALQAVCANFLGEPEKPRDVLHRAWQPLLTLPSHPPKIETVSLEELYKKSSKATKVLQILFGEIYDQSITVQEVKELKSYASTLQQLHSSISNDGKDITKLFAQAESTILGFEEKLKQVNSFVNEWYKPIATNAEYGLVQNKLAEIASYYHMSILTLSNTNPYDIVRPLPAGLIQRLYEHRDSGTIKAIWVHCTARNRQDFVKIAGWQGTFTDRITELAEKLISKRLNLKTAEEHFRSSTMVQIQAEVHHIVKYSSMSLGSSTEIAGTIQKAVQVMTTRDSLEALLDIGVHTGLQDESWQQLKQTVQRLKVPGDFTLDEFTNMINSVRIMQLSEDNASTLKKIVASSRLLQWMLANQALIADLSSEIEILQGNDKTNLLADLEAIKHVFGTLMIVGSQNLASFQEFVELVQRHANLLTKELGEQLTTTEARILDIEEILQELRSHNASIGFLKKISDYLNADILFTADNQHEPTIQLLQNDAVILGKSGLSALIKQMSLSDHQTDKSNELLNTLLQCVKLHRALRNLHDAFHFNFYSYTIRVKIKDVVKKSDGALFHLETEFESWQKEVKLFRSKFYCMNILTVRELNILLDDIQRKRSRFIFGLQLQSLNNTDPPEIPIWNIPDRCATELPTSKIVTPTELLTHLAKYLTAKYRPIGAVERKEVFGIRLFTLPSATELSVCLLSVYIKYAERMPTVDEVLLCSPATTIEDVAMFCNRIALASKVLNKLYTCVAINRLTAPVRTKLLKSLQKLKQDNTLAICVLTENREMTLPFAMPQPCPVVGLQHIKDAINSHLQSRSIRAQVVTSNSPGAGKTHYIKTSSSTTSVPVYPSTDLTMLIKHFNSYPKKSWHIDILHSTNETSQYVIRKSNLLQMYGGGRASRIHEDVADFLLKLIIFGLINDSAGNIFHVLRNSELFIEYNRGISPLDNKMDIQKMPAILSLLECRPIRTNPSSFEPENVAPLLQAYPAATSLQISIFLKLIKHAPGLTAQEQQALTKFAMRLFFRSEALDWKSLDVLILPVKAKKSLLQVTLRASALSSPHKIDLSGTEQMKSGVRAKFPSIQMNDPKFSYTPDNLCKMMLIWTLLQCGIPVLIMGETGCGKTYLMRQLAKAFGIGFRSLEVHGDTSEDAIKTFMEETVKEPAQPTLVFFDEINATPAIGLFKELVCNRTLRGKPIANTILIAAACNPYRKKDMKSIQGVTHLSDVCRIPRGYKQAPFSDLVYQVHPMPESMMQYCLDFKGLGPDEERIYINTMDQQLLPPSLVEYSQTFCKLIFASHEIIRRHSDYSAVSLRDVDNCLSLAVWFHQILKYDQCPFSHPFPRKMSCVAPLFVVFYCRLTTSGRQMYCQELAKVSELECSADDLVNIYNSLLDGFVKCFELDNDIVPSYTLKENLFLEFVCIINKIPLFIVGYPGTSKSLTIRTLLNQLRGSRSKHRFLQQFPKLQGFFIQGAPTVNASTISECFDLADKFQMRTNVSSFISVVVIEEVGLIELGTELSLKVLHGLLDTRSVAFVGLTNWILDQAKMNRSVTLITTFPQRHEIIALGRWALQNTQDPAITDFLHKAADVFFERWNQDTSSISLRDYYYFAWNLRNRLESNGVVTEVDFNNALAKNFGHKSLNSSKYSKIEPVLENINDATARHLLIETPSATQILSLLQDAIVQLNRDIRVLRGSYFPDDRSSWMAQQFFKTIKEALMHGSVLILYQMDNILDSLLEVLNKRYLKVGAVYYTRIAFGIHTETCRINPNLRIIIVAEELSRFSAPLLSRVEKHSLVPSDFTTYQANSTILKKAQEWIQLFLSYVAASGDTIALQDALVGYHVHYLESLINASASTNSFTEKLKTQLLKMFTAEFQVLLALARSKVSRRNAEVEHHLTKLFSGDLGSFTECFAREQGKQSLNVIFTYSKDIPIGVNAEVITLSSFQTQHHFLATLKIRSGSATNVIISCSLLQFEHQIIDFIQAECENLHASRPIQYFIIVEMDQTPLPIFFRAKWQYQFLDSLQLSSAYTISRASEQTWFQYFRATQYNQPMSSFCTSNLLNLVGALLYSQCSADVITKAVYDMLTSSEASKVFALIETVAEKLCNSDRSWLSEFRRQNKQQKFRSHCSMHQQLALAVSQKLISCSAWVLAHFGQNNAFEVLNLKDPEHQDIFSAIFDKVAKKILNRVETNLLSMPDLQSDFKYSFLFSPMIFELCDSFVNPQLDSSQYTQLCFTALPSLRKCTRQSIFESYLKDFSHLTNKHDPQLDGFVTSKIIKAFLQDQQTLTIPDLHLAVRQLQGVIRSMSMLVRIHSATIIPQRELPFLALVQQTVKQSLQKLIDHGGTPDFLSSLPLIQQLVSHPMLVIDSETSTLIQFARISYITLQHFREAELERVKDHLAVLCQNDCLSDEFWQEVLKVHGKHPAWAISMITSVCLPRVKESLMSKDDTEAAVANLQNYLAFTIESENLPQRFVIQLFDFANTLRNSTVWPRLQAALNRCMSSIHDKELDKYGLDIVPFGLYQLSYTKHLESIGWKTSQLDTIDNPSSDFISWLEMNTQFIMLLNEAAVDIVDNMLTSPVVQKALALLSPRLQLFKAYRFYLLKAVYHAVRDEPDFFAIVERNSVQKMLPWILEFPDIIAKQQFKEFGAIYQSYRENIRTQERVSSSILQAFKAIHQRTQSENLGHVLLAKIIQRSSASEQQVINALSSNFVRTYLKPQSTDQMRTQLILHVVALVLSNPSCLLHGLLLAPQASRTKFLPAMPENFLAAIRLGEGVTQLWRCQCGFTYGIGNCGRPMATGHCPQCNRVIGGDNHTPAAGQTPIRLNSTEPYLKGLVGRELGATEALTNLAPACAHFLQLLIHCTCFASVLFNYSTPQQLAQSFTEDVPANPMDYLNKAINHNIAALSSSFNQSQTITYDYLHCILYQLYQSDLGVCVPEAALTTANEKNVWENQFKATFNSTLAAIGPRIQEMNMIVNEYQRTSAQVIQELRQTITRAQFTVNYRQEMLPHLFYWRPGFNISAFDSFCDSNQIGQYQILQLTKAKKDTINLCSKLFPLISMAKMLHQLLSGVKSEAEILSTTIGQFMSVPDFATQFTQAKECWDAVRQHINRFECEQFQLPEISEKSSVHVLLYVPGSSNLIKLVIEHLCNLHNDIINDYWRLRGKESQAPINVLDAQSLDMLVINDANALIQWIVKENEELFIHYPANQSWSLQSIEQMLENTIFAFKPSLFVDFKRLEFVPKPAEEDKFRPINLAEIGIPQVPLTQDLVNVIKAMSVLEAEKCLLELRSIVSVCKRIQDWVGQMTVAGVIKAVRGQSNELYARVPLAQLVSFQSALLKRVQKDPLDLVLHDYRIPLTNEEKRLLAEVLPKLNLQEFAEHLRQYILMLLTNAESDYLPKAEDQLKVHLPHIDDLSDLLKEQIEDLFPEGIKLRHSLDLLLYCEKMLL